MKYRVYQTTRCKKSLKKMVKRGKSRAKFLTVVRMLANGEALPPQYKDHPLHGDYEGHRDCHIEPDWILIYYKNENSLVLSLTRTGTHSDVF